MSVAFRWFVIVILAYLLGSIQFGVLISRKKNIDIRSFGSKSTGTTNVFRVLGAKASLFTFLGDCVKGVVSALIGLWVMGRLGACVCGFAVIIGHLFPVFEKFRGGKGVATTIGVCMVLNPILCLVLTVLAVIGVGIVRVVSVFSITAIALFSVINCFLCGGFVPEIILCLAILLLVLWAHRSNIRRIMDGTEFKNRLDFSK